MSSTEPIHVEQPTTMNSPMTNTINTSPPTTPTVPMSNVEMPGYMKRTFDLGEAVMGVIRVDDDGILSFSSSHSQAAMVSVDCALIHELKITRRHKKGIPRNTKGIRIKYSNDDVIIALNDDQVPILMRKIEQYRALPPYVKETLRLLRDEVIHDRKDKDKTVREANEMKETFDATINSLKDALHDSEEKLRSKDEEIAQLKIMINQYSKDLAEKNNQLQKERQLFDQYKNSTTETIALLESTVNRLQIEAIGDSSSYHIPTQSYGSLSRSEEKSVAPSSSSSSTFTSASYHPMNIDQRTDIVESPTIVTDRPPLPQTSTFTSSPIPQPPVDLKPTASPIEYISTGYANLPTSENYSSTSHPQSTNPASLGTTLHSPQQPQQVELQAKDPEQREEEHYRSENISEDKQDEPEFEEGKEFDFRHLMKKFTKPKPATDESEGGGVEEKKIIGAGRRVMFF